VRRWCFSFNSGDNDHAETHADTTDNQEELASEAINDPHRVQCENDTEGGVEGVDEGDRSGVGKHLLVDLRRVRVQGALSSDLLTGVDDERQSHTLAQGLVLPERTVVAGDGFLFVLESLTDPQDFLLNFLFSLTDSAQSRAGLLDVVTSLEEPGTMSVVLKLY
jgi:hypothetical protein